MFSIVKASKDQAKLISSIAKEAFLPAHGHSASKKDIDAYVSKSFNEVIFEAELSNPAYQYHLIYYKNQIAGYSKIVFNCPNTNITAQNITKLERLYLLKEYYGLDLGKILFDFNVSLSKENNQVGLWLAVWVENYRAIKFYEKVGFQKVGSFDFEISKTHYNPNHILYLKYDSLS